MHRHTLQQTKNWAEFRKAAKDEKYFRIEIDQNSIYYEAFLQKMPLPLGKCWLYCNRGPGLQMLDDDIFKEFIEKANKIAAETEAVFLRIEPPFDRDSIDGNIYLKMIHRLGFRDAHASHQPECTLYIDLELTEREILAQMKQKGRYNIKIAEKHGVKVLEGAAAKKRMDDFYKILGETHTRDGFSGHDKKFYEKMLEMLGENAELYLAEYEGEIVAGTIVTFFEDTATYYYGASGSSHRNVMAPYLLQWHAIKEARKRGHLFYDFMGIAPPGAKKHPWEGVTDFKRKFGGEILHYVHAQEFVFKPFWYRFIILAKKLKGIFKR